MLTTNYVFKMASTVDRTIPLNQQLSTNIFNTIDMIITIYSGSVKLFAYLFRYSRGLGFGLA